METHEHIMAYYPLFEHMQNEHGLTLLESELQEIIRLSDKVKQNYNEASERSPFPSTDSKCEDLKQELEVTDKLLNERQKVLDAIPECPIHGSCIPHAIEWIEGMKAKHCC